MRRGLVKTIEAAAEWIDHVGIALLLPKDDLVLPSLWEAVAGHADVEWAVTRPDGKLEFTPEMARVWAWKDELPARRLACVGKHVRNRVALVSLDVLPALVALQARGDLAELERDVAEVVAALAPCTIQDIRDALPQHDGKRVPAAVDRLQRQLVLTVAGLEERDRGWSALLYDCVQRRYGDRLTTVRSPEEARAEILARVLAAVGELSAADVAGAFGWRHADAVAALDSVEAERSEDDGIALWRPRRQSRANSAA